MLESILGTILSYAETPNILFKCCAHGSTAKLLFYIHKTVPALSTKYCMTELWFCCIE